MLQHPHQLCDDAYRKHNDRVAAAERRAELARALDRREPQPAGWRTLAARLLRDAAQRLEGQAAPAEAGSGVPAQPS